MLFSLRWKHIFTEGKCIYLYHIDNGLQAVAPEGACHDNVKKCFTKNWEVFWNIFPFLHRWIWCDEKIKEYVTFYAYFSRMQNVFHFKRWEFFSKKSCFFSTLFVNVFSNVIDDNRSTHVISFFPFSFFNATWTLTDRNFDRIRNECVQKKTLFQLLWFTLERY